MLAVVCEKTTISDGPIDVFRRVLKTTITAVRNHPTPHIFLIGYIQHPRHALADTFPALLPFSRIPDLDRVKISFIVLLDTEYMAELTSNHAHGTKRKSEDGERNSRAKRNRYISIAWCVIYGL
jgi:hypothetical protein